MSDRFIALPVNQGDAFYLEKDMIKILVDGGINKTQIVPLIDSYCSIDKLDVLICTHNDSDHANGVLGLLRDWGRDIEEVWLPGSWTYRLSDMDHYEFYDELISNIMESEDDANRLCDLKIEREEFNDFREETEMDISLVLDSLNHYNKTLLSACSCYLPMNLFERHENKMRLLLEAITTANRIMGIAKEAYTRGCKIRFFEYCNPDGKTVHPLQPMNSKEIGAFRKKNLTALEYLALSVSNKESLVFLSPETENSPAVLFTADSDLAFMQKLEVNSFEHNLIVTASHHGSVENECVYSIVKDWSNADSVNIHWARSDCKSKKRPCTKFKQQESKYCTRCNPEYLRQSVAFDVISGNWVASYTKKCTCR